jgi:hypothetical protein
MVYISSLDPKYKGGILNESSMIETLNIQSLASLP